VLKFRHFAKPRTVSGHCRATTITKWTAIILTSIGSVYCINLARQPIGFAIKEGMFLFFVILPLTIFLLNVYHNTVTKYTVTNKIQIGLTATFIFIASLTTYYLIDLIIIKNDGWDYQRFKDLSGDNTGQFYLDKRIGFAGLILLTFSWLTTSLNLRQTNQKIILATVPLIFHIALWTIIYFAYQTTPNYNPDSGG